MDPMTMMMLLKGGSTLFRLFGGGGKQTQGYQMSPQEQEIYDALYGQWKGDVPASVTAPFVGMTKRKEQELVRYPGLSGTKAREFGQIGTLQSGAVKGYKDMLVSQMSQLARGGGTRTVGTAEGWGEQIGGGLEDIGLLLLLQQILGGEKTGKSGEKTGKSGGYAMSSGSSGPSGFRRRLNLTDAIY